MQYNQFEGLSWEHFLKDNTRRNIALINWISMNQQIILNVLSSLLL